MVLFISLALAISVQATISSITLNSPINNTITDDPTPDFDFTAESTADSTFSCSAKIDGVTVATNATTSNNTATMLSSTTLAGIHNWNISCTDSGGSTTSETRIVQVEIEPSIMLNSPANNALTAGSVNFNFTATDNADSSLDCTLKVDGADRANNASTLNGTPTILTASLTSGVHTWTVSCGDSGPNYNESDAYTINADGTAPTITLLSPSNGNSFNGLSAMLTWNATDNQDTSILCDVSVDGSTVAANQASANSTSTSVTITLSSYGAHQWNVACKDNIPNTGTSSNFTFTANNPPSSSGGGGGGGSSTQPTTSQAPSTTTPELTPGLCPAGTTYCAGNCCSSSEVCKNGACIISSAESSTTPSPTETTLETTETTQFVASRAEPSTQQPLQTGVFDIGKTKANKGAIAIGTVAILGLLAFGLDYAFRVRKKK